MRRRTLLPTILAIASLLALAAPASAMYQPTLGRWLTRDPIAYQGGANLHLLYGLDPFGLDGAATHPSTSQPAIEDDDFGVRCACDDIRMIRLNVRKPSKSVIKQVMPVAIVKYNEETKSDLKESDAFSDKGFMNWVAQNREKYEEQFEQVLTQGAADGWGHVWIVLPDGTGYGFYRQGDRPAVSDPTKKRIVKGDVIREKEAQPTHYRDFKACPVTATKLTDKISAEADLKGDERLPFDYLPGAVGESCVTWAIHRLNNAGLKEKFNNDMLLEPSALAESPGFKAVSKPKPEDKKPPR